jgi:glycosyltransferase involved in cell wall biosynthesis
MEVRMPVDSRRIGFVSTRFAGTDGVSLETAKWARIIQTMGHRCFYFAGELDLPEEVSYLVPEAHFEHPEILKLNEDLFDDYVRRPETSEAVQVLKDHLKAHLHQFIERFGLELFIVENALSIPMNVPLGLALTEVIAETNIPTVAHHHDFSWERGRFGLSAADDYLRASFPPTLYPIRHVVINTFAARQLALRTGVSSSIIPNVMDFNSPAPERDEYSRQMRVELGIAQETKFLLQPTRIVPRKRIEMAIELTRRLEMDAVLVISHESGDEGSEYEAFLREYAALHRVDLRFASGRFSHQRGRKEDGSSIFSLDDAYLESDLVTYPSRVEGFGNAFLETIYFRKPIVMSTYAIFRTDIEPKGFQVIGFEDYLTEACVRHARQILTTPEQVASMVAHNFNLGERHYSFQILEKDLATLISECFGL